MESHYEFAWQKAIEGRCGSENSVVAVGIEQLMQDEEEREIALQAMAQTIRTRMEVPDDEWIEGVDDLFAKTRQRLSKWSLTRSCRIQGSRMVSDRSG